MELQSHFRSDADVREVFGEHAYATLEYVSRITPHKRLAESLLLDPSCARGAGYCPLHVEHMSLKVTEARTAAQDVRDATLQARARQSAPRKHRISFPERSPEPHSNVYIDIHEYTVPVAYKVLGVLCDSGTETEYAVRVVWERHCCAILGGQIVRVQCQFRQRDAAIVSAVQQLQGKSGSSAGDPLPIANALAQIVLASRGGIPSNGQWPDDVRDLVTADEVGVEVDVVDAVEYDQPPQREGQITQDEFTAVLENVMQQSTVRDQQQQRRQQQSQPRHAPAPTVGDTIPALEHDDDESDSSSSEVQVTFRNPSST